MRCLGMARLFHGTRRQPLSPYPSICAAFFAFRSGAYRPMARWYRPYSSRLQPEPNRWPSYSATKTRNESVSTHSPSAWA